MRRAGLSKTARRFGTLLLTAGCVAYILLKIDIRETLSVLAHADLAYFAAASAIAILVVLPMSWRWQRLLAARGVGESFAWLTRTYYVSYAAAQVLQRLSGATQPGSTRLRAATDTPPLKSPARSCSNAPSEESRR